MLANFPEPPSSQVRLGGDARQLFQPMKSTKARAVWNDFCESVPWQIHWGSMPKSWPLCLHIFQGYFWIYSSFNIYVCVVYLYFVKDIYTCICIGAILTYLMRSIVRRHGYITLPYRALLCLTLPAPSSFHCSTYMWHVHVLRWAVFKHVQTLVGWW